MARDEQDYQDAAEQPRSRTDRLAGSASGGSNEPNNPNWRQRATRPTGRNPRVTQPIPTSSQDFVVWLQYGGWRFVLAAVLIVAFVALAIILTSQPPDTAGTILEPTLTGAKQPITLQTPLPTVTAGPAVPSPQPASVTGAKFRVTGTGAEGLFLRPQPNRDGAPITTLQEGSEVTVVGEDRSQTDGVWKNVRDASGNTGWAFGQFLKAVGP